ncbi:MFS transporter [Paenibacillus sp. YN15]|uniref:MFS transporter n=1 Tax=Paenibacillus sp. YN15 TaxID=1742774 RepID=UPI000DCCF6D4|nr:MFS transporter [Paenibacillus sp. YN15]RAV05645.1 MFS transporter [Paenibacillus sp. YN15]
MKTYITDMLQFSPGVRRFLMTETLLGIGLGMATLLLNLHLLALGLTETQLGAISSAGSICMGAVSIPCGLLANRFGRKKLLVLGVGLMGIGYGGFAFANELWLLFLAQIMQSVGMSLLVTTEIQLLYSYSTSRQEETRGFSMLFAVFTLFTGVGTLAGGFLPRLLGGARTDYQWSLLAAGLCILACSVLRLAVFPREQAPPAASRKKSAASGSGGGRGRLKLPGKAVWIFCGMNLLLAAFASFVEPFLNVIIKFRLEWPDGMVSLLLTLNGLAQFIGSFLMPVLLERLGIRRTYRLVFLTTLLGTLLLAAAVPAAAFSVLLLIRGGASIVTNNLVLTHTMSVTSEAERNAYAGIRQVTRSIGASAAIYTAGILLAGKNYALPFLGGGIMLAASWIFFRVWVEPLIEAGMAQKEKG